MKLIDRKTGEIVERYFDVDELQSQLDSGATLSEIEMEFYSCYVLQCWIESRDALVEAKAAESAWRELLVWVHGMTDRIGSLALQYANGIDVTIKREPNYTLDDKGELLTDTLNKIYEDYPAIEDLLSWSPSVKPGVYKKLPEPIQRQLDDVITVKPAAAKVEIGGEAI